MASFVLLIDPLPERRARFAGAAMDRIAPVGGLAQGTLESADLFAGWAAEPRGPVSASRDGRGANLVWGDEFGYHAAVAYDTESSTVSVTADRLGLFPVYYWAGDGVLLVG